MSLRKTRERRLPPAEDAWPDGEADPSRFFGDGGGSRRGRWKLLQLCKQAERAAAVTLAGCESDVLAGAVVASVEPAPDAGRLRVTVVIAPGHGLESIERARMALLARVAAFREEVARSVHRKRVPDLVFDVSLAAEVDRG